MVFKTGGSPTNAIDRTNKKYHSLLVLELSHSKNGRRYWKCRCDCGKETIVAGGKLGTTKSCGCKFPYSTHRMSFAPEYRTWAAVIQRCTNSRCTHFRNYGGRGIMVCGRWLNSFEAFFSDMGPKPSPKHSIDRFPDPNGNYEPGNCRWATTKEQLRNTRKTIYATIDGVTLSVRDWCDKFGISYPAFRSRRKKGWSIEKALTDTPPGRLKDLSGREFGAWTVDSYAGESRWNCHCKCGVERVVLGQRLVAGITKSCGCLAWEHRR